MDPEFRYQLIVEMSESLPLVLQPDNLPTLVSIAEHELGLLTEARRLYDAGFPAHALLNFWNAAIHNLRRRVESYSVDIFLSTIKEEGGRKNFDKKGETIQERWPGVDDLVLISGATRLGILNKKAGKALEMINWMRNHASPAHDSPNQVKNEDVFAFAVLLQKNLFEDGMPDPGHSPSGLFEPVKNSAFDAERQSIIADQIRSYRASDIRVTFGFLTDLICEGSEPGLGNARILFPIVWEAATDDLKGTAGFRYQSLILSPESDTSVDKGAKLRLLETLVQVGGVSFIPDGARAKLYRHAASLLAIAKNTSYGWTNEEAEGATLAQFGTNVPSICFEEVYQEILSVWCGNYWGRSTAYTSLRPFIDRLNTEQIRAVASLFETNERVKSELGQTKPKAAAIALLDELKTRLTIASHLGEIDRVKASVQAL